MDSKPAQPLDRFFVEASREIIIGQQGGAVPAAVQNGFLAEPAVLVDLKDVDGHMRRTEMLDPIQTGAPTFAGLSRQTGDQVDIDIRYSTLPEQCDLTCGDLRRMPPSRAPQFIQN